jgi:hypothetical protein
MQAHRRSAKMRQGKGAIFESIKLSGRGNPVSDCPFSL